MKKDTKQLLFEMMQKVNPDFVVEQEDVNDINPKLKDFYNQAMKYADEEINDNKLNLKKFEYLKLNSEINSLYKILLPILTSAKFVYDNPEFWKSRGAKEYVFDNDFDIKYILYDRKYNRINHPISLQLKYYNADNKVPQPTWVADFKKYVGKLKILQEKYDTLHKEIYGDN